MAGSPRLPDRVPVEFIGLARVLRSKVAAAYDEWSAAAEALLRPLHPRGDFQPVFTKKMLGITAARWGALPARWGRFSNVTKRIVGAEMQIHEIRAQPLRVMMGGWNCDELNQIATTHKSKINH